MVVIPINESDPRTRQHAAEYHSRFFTNYVNAPVAVAFPNDDDCSHVWTFTAAPLDANAAVAWACDHLGFRPVASTYDAASHTSTITVKR